MSIPQTENSTPPQALRLWDKLLIIVGEGTEAGTYASRVDDVLDDGLIVTDPEFMSGHVRLRRDLPVVVQFTRDDAVYQFESRITRRPERDNRAFLTLPRNFKRVQRRLFVRVEYREKVEYALVGPTTDWSGWPRSLEWTDSASCDISGGGMRIVGNEFAAVGTILLLRLRSFRDEGLPEYVFAVCRRVMREGKDVFLGLEFVISELIDRAAGAPESALLPAELRRFDHSVQNKLVVWIFQRQIHLRQKGLL